MKFDRTDTAVVIIAPQNDVLSPTGKNWDAVGASVTENDTVAHLVDILASAKSSGFAVFISTHYFYPTDSAWLFNGPLESDELRTNTFARTGPLRLEGFAGSGADWLDELRPHMQDGKTVVASPHKVWGPSTNDLIPQLRKTRNRQGHPVRHAREHLRGIASARTARERIRSRGRTRRYRWPPAPLLARRLPSGAGQLRVLAHAVVSTAEVVNAMSSQ